MNTLFNCPNTRVAIAALMVTGITVNSSKVFAQTQAGDKPQNTAGNEIFTEAETPANFPGGIENFYAYVEKNKKYPAEAMQKDIHGHVFVTFVVEKDGSLSNVKLMRGIGGGCDDEAVRLIKGSPKWTPGRQNGNLVRQQFTVPVSFGKAKQLAPVHVADVQGRLGYGYDIRIDEPVPNTKPGGEDTNEIFTAVEETAEYPKGIDALYKYIEQHIIYPAAAKRNNVAGKVFITFVVEKDGSLTNFKVLRGIGSGCDEEAVRVVTLSAKWTPGHQNGHAVRVQYTMPVTFNN